MAEALVLGVYDILTPGHFDMLGRASRFGRVAVGLTADDLAEATKRRRPLFTFEERRQSLEQLGFAVVERSSIDVRPVFEAVRPQVFVCGNDHLASDHLDVAGITHQFLDALGIAVVYTPRIHDISTSKLIDRMRERIASEEAGE